MGYFEFHEGDTSLAVNAHTRRQTVFSYFSPMEILIFCDQGVKVGLGSSVGWEPAGLTYVFAKGVSDQVRDPLTPRNSLQ